LLTDLTIVNQRQHGKVLKL